MRELLGAARAARLFRTSSRAALQPRPAAAERLRPDASRARTSPPRTSGPGAARCSRRSSSPSTARPRPETEAKRRVAAVMRHGRRASSETRRPSRARRTSACGDRAVSRRANDRGFPPAAFARRRRARCRPRSGRAGHPEPAAFVANSRCARGRVNCPEFRSGGDTWHGKRCSSATAAVTRSTRRSGAVMRITYTDARRGAKAADLCDDCAGRMPGRAAARPGPPAEDRTRGLRAPALPVLRRLDRPRPRYDGKVGLSLLAGPANAGKVALLLERYLARLDDEPTLIVPNRSDVDRVERDLLARSGCLLRRLDRHVRRPLRAPRRGDPAQRAGRDATSEQALVVRRRSQRRRSNGLARSARTGGFVDTLARTLGELDQGLLDPDDLDGDLAALYAALPRRARPARALGPRPAAPPRRRAARGPTSTPGTASRSSPTASRTSPAPSGRCSRRWPGAPRSRSRCRTSRAAPPSPRSGGRPRISPRSPPAASRSFRRARASTRIRRSRISSARCSTSRRPAAGARRRRALPRGSRGRAARSSSSARRCSR